MRVVYLTSAWEIGKKLADVLPEFDGMYDLELLPNEAAFSRRVDAMFLAMGHGEACRFLEKYPYLDSTRIVDLSADFRFRDARTYQSVYGKTVSPDINRRFVYGLTEVFRANVRKARYIANPGCYVTSVLLPLYPLLKSRVIRPSGPITVIAASGTSGAGAVPRTDTHYCQVDEDYCAYKPLRSHAHLPEIEEILSPFRAMLTFTPHLLPLKQGILSDIVVRMDAMPEDIEERIQKAWRTFYRGCAFVRPVKHLLHISEVAATNQCRFTVRADKKTRSILILSALDNLIKGASGQAVQNLNVMYGWPEQTALEGRI